MYVCLSFFDFFYLSPSPNTAKYNAFFVSNIYFFSFPSLILLPTAHKPQLLRNMGINQEDKKEAKTNENFSSAYKRMKLDFFLSGSLNLLHFLKSKKTGNKMKTYV